MPEKRDARYVEVGNSATGTTWPRVFRKKIAKLQRPVWGEHHVGVQIRGVILADELATSAAWRQHEQRVGAWPLLGSRRANPPSP